MARKSRNRRKNTKRKTRRRRVIKGGDPTIKSLPISLLNDVQGPLIDKYDLETGLPKRGMAHLKFVTDINWGRLIYYRNEYMSEHIHIGKFSDYTRESVASRTYTLSSIRLDENKDITGKYTNYIVDLDDPTNFYTDTLEPPSLVEPEKLSSDQPIYWDNTPQPRRIERPLPQSKREGKLVRVPAGLMYDSDNDKEY